MAKSANQGSGAARRAARANSKRRATRRRKLRPYFLGAVALVLAVVVIVIVFGSSGSGSPRHPRLQLVSLKSLGHLEPPGTLGPLGPEGVPIPGAPAFSAGSAAANGQTTDGISCQSSEQVVFHIHAHLTIYINGSARQVPYGIGIPGAQVQSTSQGPFVGSGTCFYWLHTHAADGIIHIESPVQRTYTLGNFFDLWGVSLGPNGIGQTSGHVTALYNGQLFVGNPRNIPLTAHAQIQLEIGRPLIAPVSVAFPNGL